MKQEVRVGVYHSRIRFGDAVHHRIQFVLNPSEDRLTVGSKYYPSYLVSIRNLEIELPEDKPKKRKKKNISEVVLPHIHYVQEGNFANRGKEVLAFKKADEIIPGIARQLELLAKERLMKEFFVEHFGEGLE